MKDLILGFEEASFFDEANQKTINYKKYYVDVEVGGLLGTQRIYLSCYKNDRNGKLILSNYFDHKSK